MHPVRTAGSNFIYRGPTPDVADAWVRREPRARAVYLTWQLSPEERAAIAAGATLRLGIFEMEPIPPVSLAVSDEQELSEAGAALRDRALRALVAIQAEDTPTRPGWWVVSTATWHVLNAERALDPSDGVPTLLGRPLIQVVDDDDLLEFNPGTSTPEGRA